MSLRRATLATLALTLMLVAICAAWLTYAHAVEEANEFMDRQQQQMARYVGSGTFAGADAVSMPSGDLEDDYVVVVRDRDSQRSSHPEVPIPEATRTGFTDFAAKGLDWRLFSFVQAERTVQIAQQLAVRREIAEDGAWNAAIPILAAIPVVWIILALVLQVVFRPLEQAARDVGRRAATDTRPIAAAGMPHEVRPFITAINALLGQLEAVMAQQRAFVADAAHELRTPLAALTLQLGNVKAVTVGPPLAERLDEFDRGLRRASALVDKLLFLARTEAVQPDRPATDVALDAIITEVVADLTPLALERDIDLGLVECRPLRIRGQREEVYKLAEILIDNAIRHSTVGATVDVNLLAREGGAALVVSDGGPGIAPELLPRVFERFFRAAAPDIEGSGLGLAIARSIAERNGFQISLKNRIDGTTGLDAIVSFGESTVLTSKRSTPTGPGGSVQLGSQFRGFRGHITGIAAERGGVLSADERERRLVELGITEGARVEILYEGLFGRDPIALRVDGNTVALRRQEAQAILVQPE